MAYVSLAIFLVVVAVLWSTVLIFFMARTLLRPRRMTDVRALARLGRMTPTSPPTSQRAPDACWRRQKRHCSPEPRCSATHCSNESMPALSAWPPMVKV